MAVGSDFLVADETLRHNQSIRSANGAYEFVHQSDGNLVLYKNYARFPRRALWASGTAGTPTDNCIMQKDGNLVLYDPAGKPQWASGTQGNPVSRLVVQDDGNAVIYRGSGSPSWATNTVQKQVPSGPAATGPRVNPGWVLAVNSPVMSANGRYSFTFQSDGNLVLYKRVASGRILPLWASNTQGVAAELCIMQTDGNLVIYDPDGDIVWMSDTSGFHHLVVQDDGNVVIYGGRTPQWATDTNGMRVHFKSLVPLTAARRAFLTGQFDAMDELYVEGRINVELATFEDLSGDPAVNLLADLDTGDCGETTTADQEALFAYRNNAEAKDVIVYLCRTLLGPIGCATHPAGRPGCAIREADVEWLVAHEIGHVLGLKHADRRIPANDRFLMWPSIDWNSPPPDIRDWEYEAMRYHPLTPI